MEASQLSDAQEVLQPVHKWLSAYRFVKGEIKRGRWCADEIISANVIASELGMSRSPVQQALRVLATDGLVETVPQVGCMIRRPLPSEIEESFTIRLALDRLAGELAAERAGDDAIARLENIIEKSESAASADDGAEYAQLNRMFHSALYDIASSKQLRAAADRLWEPFQSPDDAAPFFAPRMKQSVQEHRAILSAIARHDSDEAGRLVKRHLEGCKVSVLTYFGTVQQLRR